jgi:hypothetical protein
MDGTLFARRRRAPECGPDYTFSVAAACDSATLVALASKAVVQTAPIMHRSCSSLLHAHVDLNRVCDAA